MMSVLSRVAEDIEKTITTRLEKRRSTYLRVFIRLCMKWSTTSVNIIRLTWTSGPKSTKRKKFDRSSLNIIGNSVLHALRLSKGIEKEDFKSMQWSTALLSSQLMTA